MNGTNKRLCTFGCGQMTQHSTPSECIRYLKTANTILRRYNEDLRRQMAVAELARQKRTIQRGLPI